MPKYRQCRECSTLTEMPACECVSCHSKISFQAMNQNKDYHTVHTVFPSGLFRDIDYEPVYCKGKGDLRHATRERGQVSLYAED